MPPGEKIEITISDKGTRIVRRNVLGIGEAAVKTNASVSLLKTSLLGIGAGLALRSTIRTIAEFEQQMSSVQGVTQATEQQMISLTAVAQELGSTTRFSATQAAEGLLFLARAGFTANEQLETIGQTLQLAQAGGLDLGSAADIASNALRGFRLEASESGRVVDVLALAANSSNTNVQQLGDALKFVAPIAAGVGIEIEETTAAIGALSDAGLQASLAGTGLRRILSELESPASKTVKILKSVGLTTDDVRVSEVGLTAALIKLRDAGIDTGQALELFGDRGGPAFEVLSTSLPQVQRMTQALKEADGTAKRIAETMDDNLNGALLAVRSAIEAVQISFGQLGASNFLTGFFNGLADSIRGLANNIEILDGALVGLAVGAIPAVIQGLRLLKGAIAGTGFGLIAIAIGTASGALIAFKDDIFVLGDGVTTLGDLSKAAFEVIASAIDSTVNALGGLFGSEFLQKFQFTFDNAGLIFETFVRGVAQGLDTFFGFFVGLRRAVESSFTAIPKAIADAIITIINGLITSIETAIDSLVAGFKLVGSVASNIAEGIFQSFTLSAAAVKQALAGNAQAAAEISANAALILKGRLGEAVRDLPGKLADIYQAEADTNLLPRLNNIAEGGGQEFASSFAQGFQEGMAESSLFEGAADDLFNRSREIAQERLAQENLQKLAQDGQTVVPGDGKSVIAKIVGDKDEQKELLTFFDGIGRGIKTLETQITDFSSLGESSITNAFANAEDALVSFVQTGKLDFSGLVNSILSDLIKLTARQAITGLFGLGGGGGGLLGGLLGGGGEGGGGLLGGLFNFGGARAEGGPVNPNQSFLVGEQGPELFTPSSSGNIAPAASIQSPPQVNVQVVNVMDPKEAINALNTPEGTRMVLNIINENPEAIRNTA